MSERAHSEEEARKLLDTYTARVRGLAAMETAVERTVAKLQGRPGLAEPAAEVMSCMCSARELLAALVALRRAMEPKP